MSKFSLIVNDLYKCITSSNTSPRSCFWIFVPHIVLIYFFSIDNSTRPNLKNEKKNLHVCISVYQELHKILLFCNMQLINPIPYILHFTRLARIQNFFHRKEGECRRLFEFARRRVRGIIR